MKFAYLMMYVANIEESLRLYRDVLGLEVERRYQEPGGIEAVFVVEKGEIPMKNKAMIELVAATAAPKPAPNGFLLGFEVRSLEQMTQTMLARGYPLTLGPYSPDPSVVISHFRGPDGEEIGLMEWR